MVGPGAVVLAIGANVFFVVAIAIVGVRDNNGVGRRVIGIFFRYTIGYDRGVGRCPAGTNANDGGAGRGTRWGHFRGFLFFYWGLFELLNFVLGAFEEGDVRIRFDFTFFGCVVI